MIAIVGCSKTKLSHRARADQLYTGALFRDHLRLAEALEPRDLFILSAKHGLVGREVELDPYDLSLAQLSKIERRRWTLKIAEAVEVLVEPRELVVVLAGGDYLRWTKVDGLACRIWTPLEGLMLGERRRVVRALTGGRS